MDRHIRKLIRSLDALTEENRKLVSPLNNFFRGIILGIGSAIGASVIAAIIIGIIAKFFESLRNLYFQ